jgi:hypothetical protein
VCKCMYGMYVRMAQCMYASSRSRHFMELYRRYGGPIAVLNLVKKKEKVARERLIGDEFGRAVAFLNKSLPFKHRIQYLHLDYSGLVSCVLDDS